MASEPTTDPRAAQIEAAVAVLAKAIRDETIGHSWGQFTDLAAELVDAVHAAGRDGQGDAMADLTEERLTTMARRAWRAEEALNAARAAVEQLRYERRLLGVARMTLDLVAAGDPTRWDHARAEAEDVAQRIVDEIGHPVTDEPALGPDLRAQLAEAKAQADQGEARGYAQAVAALLDTAAYKRWHQQVYATTGVDHHRWNWNNRVTLADYLEAVGPDGTAVDPAPAETIDLDAWRGVCLDAFHNLAADTSITMAQVDTILRLGAQRAHGGNAYEQLLDELATQTTVGRDDIDAVLTWSAAEAARLLDGGDRG